MTRVNFRRLVFLGTLALGAACFGNNDEVNWDCYVQGSPTPTVYKISRSWTVERANELCQKDKGKPCSCSKEASNNMVTAP